MVILGLSAFEHDSAAALVVNGEVCAAIEENKLARMSMRGLPYHAIDYCLREGGVEWGDVTAVAVATRPWAALRRESALRSGMAVVAPIASAYYLSRGFGDVARDLNNFRLLRAMARDKGKARGFEHHLCHAASAFYASAFERALVVTFDENGDGVSGTIALGEGSRIRRLRETPFPHSVGWVYSQVTDLLGFAPHKDEHKTQWLSLAGEPVFADVLLRVLRRKPGPLPNLDFSSFTRGVAGKLAFSARLYREFGLDPKNPREMSNDTRATLAASLQQACTTVVCDTVAHYAERQHVEDVCLAGGVFQNPLLVAAVEEKFGVQRVFAQPVAGNAGTALGAAWVVEARESGRPGPLKSLYLGPSYQREEIKEVLDNSKLPYRFCATEQSKIDTILPLLRAGKIVAWFQGRAEFGPRALGNRSLLASPWAEYVKENLNDFIKHREWFRPFALAVTAEDCPQYFEASRQARFMCSMAKAHDTQTIIPEGFVLRGGRVRLFIVEQRTNRLFWRLLKRFGEQAPAPMLLNTSFNLFGEPLVVEPRDAVRSFFSSGVDAMMLDNFLLTKPSAQV